MYRFYNVSEFVSSSAYESVYHSEKGTFNVSCHAGWTLLTCGSHNSHGAPFDPSRSVWHDGSTCYCHDDTGMTCSAWCTRYAVPEVEQTIITLDKDCDTSNSAYVCPNSSTTLISCFFKGNTNGSLQREQGPQFYTMAFANICFLGGLKNDEFVMTCMKPSNSVRVDIGLSNFLQANASQVVQCPRAKGNIINCQTRDSGNHYSYANIMNETACQCYSTDPNAICDIICLRKTVFF